MIIILYSSVLFLIPGFLFLFIIGYLGKKFFLSLFISYLLLLADIKLAVVMDLQNRDIVILYGAQLTLLLIGVLARISIVYRKQVGGIFKRVSSNTFLTGLYIVTGGVTAYLLGPYTEIPSDFWQHLENIRAVRRGVESGLAAPAFNPWYISQGWIWHLSGVSFDSYIVWVWVFNLCIFGIGVYSFTTGINESLGCPIIQNHILGLSAVLLTVMFFGVGVFSYVRYYAFAPGYFCYVLYLWAVLSMQQCIATDMLVGQRVGRLIVPVGVALLTLQIHKQEAMFTVLALFFTVWWMLNKKATVCLLIPKLRIFRKLSSGPLVLANSTTLLTSIITIALLSMLCLLIIKSGNTVANEVTHRDVLQIKSTIGFLDGALLLKLNSQLAQVFGTTGGITLILALVFYYVVLSPAALLITLFAIPLTVFNPAFTELFLGYADQSVLWRLGYMAPWPILTAFVLLSGYNWMQFSRSSLRFVWIAFILCSLALVVADRVVEPEYRSFGKLATLMNTKEENTYVYWSDLITRLNQYHSSKHILTDPITGYVLASTTNHSHARFKFHKIKYIDFNLPGYSNRSFEDYTGWLLIVNRRSGAKSITGERSGHWPEDVMDTKTHYSEEFLTFLKVKTKVGHNLQTPNHPVYRFVKLWSNNKIELFEII